MGPCNDGELALLIAFALLIAISLHLFDLSFFKDTAVPEGKKWLAAAFLLTLFFWVNSRDTNIYFLELSIVSLIIGLSIPFIASRFKKISCLGVVTLVICCLIVVFLRPARGAALGWSTR